MHPAPQDPAFAGVAERLAGLRTRIADAEAAAGRAPGSVTLVAVGKTFGPAALRAAADAGVEAFGENYLQEALAKQDALADLALEWHFIGAVQSRKARTIAERFDWVHTIDRAKVARRLADGRPPDRGPLEVCIQVNPDGEASKAGVAPEEVPELAATIRERPALRLRGLMAIPAPRSDPAAQRAVFERIATLAAELRTRVPAAEAGVLDVLSLGMSGDLEAAIAAGATHVRVGSALFGPRPPAPAQGADP